MAPDTSSMTSGLVRAAGGLIVRAGAAGAPEILVVHRRGRDDWTFPKGKAEPGESDEACALREVEEETGLRCELGEELAATDYVDSSGRPKRVRYFAMVPMEGSLATLHNEVDQVAWLTREQAIETLTYRRDVALVEGLRGLVED